MRQGNRSRRGWTGLLALFAVTGCSVLGPLVFPVKYDRLSLLAPVVEPGGAFGLRDDGTVSHEVEGLRIEVKYMPDHELNARFPEESAQGRYSTNPYTYGDYVDPKLGYVRNRFTVFKVTVVNISHAKVELQPLMSLLTTDRPGEALEPYGVLSGSAPQAFESYYRALKGPDGNEDYRFNMRMGLVRTNNYAVGEGIFKGEQYEGYLVFDPLHDDVRAATLHIRDFILKFNAFGKPLETMDFSFPFQRSIAQKAMEYREAAALAQAFTEARLAAASQVLGAVTGDISRDVTAVDGFVRGRLGELNACFEGPFMEGKASEGEVSVRFAVLPSGTVEDVDVLASTVVSDEVGRCLASRVGAWRFPPSVGAAPVPAAPRQEGVGEEEGRAQDRVAAPETGATAAARVTATIYLEFSDVRPE